MWTALVGLGNPYHGHDAIGPLVARQVRQHLDDANRFTWLNLVRVGCDLLGAAGRRVPGSRMAQSVPRRW